MGREFDDYEENIVASDETGEDVLDKLDSVVSKVSDMVGQTDNEAYRSIKTAEFANNNGVQDLFQQPDTRAVNLIEVIEPIPEMPDDIRVLNRTERQDFSSIAQTFQQTVENTYKEADAWTGRDYTGKAITGASALTYGLQAVNVKGELNTYFASMTDDQLTGFATTMRLLDKNEKADISQLMALQNKEFVENKPLLSLKKDKQKSDEDKKEGAYFNVTQEKRLDAHLEQIENYYINQGINIKTLTSKEIDSLIKGDAVKGVKLKNEGEISLLESYKQGINIKKDMSIAEAAKGRGIGIGKQAISKSYEGSDFESGYGMANSMISLGKSTVSMSTVAAETGISAIATAGSSVVMKYADLRETKARKAGIYSEKMNDIAKNRRTAVKIRDAQEKPRKALSRVRNFNNKSAYGKAKVIGKKVYRFSKVKIVNTQTVKNIKKTKYWTNTVQTYNRLAESKAAKVVSAPVRFARWVNNSKFGKIVKKIVSGLNKFGLFLKGLVIKFGIAFVAILLLSAMLLTLFTGIFSVAPSAFADRKDGATPLGQTIMDELWGTQKAYQDLLIDGVITSAGADTNAVLPDIKLKQASIVDQSTGRNQYGITTDDAGHPIVGTPVTSLRFNTTYEGTIEWEEGGVSYTLTSTDGDTKTYEGSDGSTVEVPLNSSGPSDIPPTKHIEKVWTNGPIGTHGLDAGGNVVIAGECMPSDVTVDVPTVNVSYKYIDSAGRTTYTTTDGITKTYTQDDFYKALFSMATVALGYEAEDHDFYYAYVKQLFDKAYENGGYDIKASAVEMPGSAGTSDGVQWINETYEKTAYDNSVKLTIDVIIYIDASIVDMMNTDTITNEWMHANCNDDSLYNTSSYIWEGWGTDAQRTDSYQLAITMYELDWSALGINFIGRTGSLLNSAEAEAIYQDIVANLGELSGSREDFVKAAMSGIGAFSYGWGGKVTDPDNPPSSLDCSGFVSYMMYLGGVTDSVPSLNCYGMLHSGLDVSSKSGTSWDTSELKPGDLLIKNDVNGTVNGTYNHVVIYLGVFTYNGVTGPHFAECRGGKGSIISSSPKTLEYQYRINLFDD